MLFEGLVKLSDSSDNYCINHINNIGLSTSFKFTRNFKLELHTKFKLEKAGIM